MAEHESENIAVFCDFENIALGVRDEKFPKFDIALVLERLLVKGNVVVKKAYCDWKRYESFKAEMHDAAFELIEIPHTRQSGKNLADIRMVVDAMDLCYSRDHIGVFVIASGDSDFSPLVSKLKEYDKYVIGVGVKNSSSDLLIDNCDEFLFYEDIVRESQPRRKKTQLDSVPKKQQEAFERILSAYDSLLREDKELIWGSMIKQRIKRKHPGFNESYYGYNSFSKLLEDAQKRKLLKLEKDQRSGSYIVTTE